MKKLICAILVACILFALAGCNSRGTSEESKINSSIESNSSNSTNPVAIGTVSDNSESTSEIEGKIDIKAEPTLDGHYCVFITNNSDTVVDELCVQIQYLDEDGTIIDVDDDLHDMLLPGRTVVSRMDSPPKYDGVKTEFSIELGANPNYVNHADSIEVTVNKGDECIIVQITNNSGVMIDEVEYIVVLYKNKDIVSATYPEDIVDVPTNKTIVSKESTYDIEYDRFEVYINQAHTFGL